jgi:hypothetical protein
LGATEALPPKVTRRLADFGALFHQILARSEILFGGKNKWPNFFGGKPHSPPMTRRRDK